MKFSKKNIIDSILLFLFIGISGNPLFSNIIMIIVVFVLSATLFIKRRLSFDKNMFYFIVVIGFIIFIQSYIFSFFPFITYSGFVLKVLIAYFVIKIFKNRFIEKYINLIYILSLISLFLYLVANINVNILLPFSINTSGLESEYPRFSFLGLFTIIVQDIMRNPGPFWEPGAFGGYLILAMVFNFIKQGKLTNKKNRIFLLTLLTTFSTTAYLALFIFLFFVFYVKIKNIFFKLLVVSIVFGIAYTAFYNVDFLGKKIEHQLELAKNVDPYFENTNTQRFLNIMRDQIDIEGYELIGRGWHPLTRYSHDPDSQIRTVGLTDIMVKMGIPFFILIMLILYRSICSVMNYYRYSKQLYCIGFFLSITTLLISEVYFNYPLYWSFLFLLFVYKTSKEKAI